MFKEHTVGWLNNRKETGKRRNRGLSFNNMTRKKGSPHHTTEGHCSHGRIPLRTRKKLKRAIREYNRRSPLLPASNCPSQTHDSTAPGSEHLSPVVQTSQRRQWRPEMGMQGRVQGCID
ncbi:unnamed protein product [Arctogadus glacialis]